mmetsp:Transcript_20491/g.51148  ORF Transcript_20491/g.51148 Transcript_20491/m.51148 type:complete len:229 (-) Transcript_20491:816-1502(-)
MLASLLASPGHVSTFSSLAWQHFVEKYFIIEPKRLQVASTVGRRLIRRGRGVLFDEPARSRRIEVAGLTGGLRPRPERSSLAARRRSLAAVWAVIELGTRIGTLFGRLNQSNGIVKCAISTGRRAETPRMSDPSTIVANNLNRWHTISIITLLEREIAVITVTTHCLGQVRCPNRIKVDGGDGVVHFNAICAAKAWSVRVGDAALDSAAGRGAGAARIPRSGTAARAN